MQFEIKSHEQVKSEQLREEVPFFNSELLKCGYV